MAGKAVTDRTGGKRGGTDRPVETPGGPITRGEGGSPASPGGGSPGGAVGGGAKGPGTFKVSGTIVLEHGPPALNLKLRLYQRGFGGAKSALGEAVTGDQGKYEISYSPSGAPNIEMYAVGGDGQEVQLSRTKFDVAPEERLDLVAPTKLQPPATEFSRLTSAVSPYVGGKPESLKDAVEWRERRDISVLTSATGWDARALALAATAFENAARTGMPAEALYGVYRMGFPTDAGTLARVDSGAVQTALGQAAQAGIIDPVVVEPAMQAFRDFAARERLSFTPSGKLGGISDFLKSASVSAADAAAFNAIVKEGGGEDVWSRAKAAGVSAQGIARLQLQGKLAYLTLNNVELTAYLMSRVGTGDGQQLIELDFDRSATWVKAIRGLVGDDDAHLARLVPPAFEGRNTGERLSAYSDELARRVRQMDPNKVTMRQLARGDLDGLGPGARAGVQAFLSSPAAKDFRLGQTSMSRFVAEQGEAALLPGLNQEQKKAALDDVRTLHRLYSVSPSDKALNALLKTGFKSAYDIVSVPMKDFVAIVGPEVGSTRETELLYWKAQQQSATIINVFSGARQLDVAPPILGLRPPKAKHGVQLAQAKTSLVKHFPTLESLFGGVDYCECDHCNSVLSPAAYLVDILHFIDPKDLQWTFMKGLWAAAHPDHSGGYDKSKPYDALVNRRPDIPNIPLTCENTNTAMPYIDIVNEILELLVSTGSIGSRTFDTGSASSQDLIAEPQNIAWEAYVGGGGKRGLNECVYPSTLPFDLPLELVRQFLARLELPLWKLREVVGRPENLLASAGSADALTDVWFERMGLGPADVKTLTGEHDWYALYGYADAPTALAELVNAKTLSRRLGVSYKELVELIKTSFVNPAIDSLVVLHRLEVDPHDIERYLNPPPQDPLTPSEASAFKARLEGQGLAIKDLQPLWSDAVRERVVLLRAPAAGCDFSAVTLAFAKTPANSADSLTMALRRMNAFIRLQRKLGWSTQLLDGALRAFLRPDVTALDSANWADAMRTALMYLAHLQEISQRVGDRVTEEELLVLWTPIPTAGVSSLYVRLFLNRGMQGLDPAFDDKLGNYFTIGTQPKVIDHVDAVRQALQVTHEEIEQIYSHVGLQGATLSIENLSILMRHKVLARALDLSVPELLTYLQLSARTPMSALGANPVAMVEKDIPYFETIGFFRELELVRDAGLTADVLEGICRHRGSSIDASNWSQLAERLLLALSALPAAQTPPAAMPAGSDAAATRAFEIAKRQFEEGRQRERLAVLQTLSAQMGAPEPLITTLVTSVFRDPVTGKPLIEESLASRAGALPSEGTTWRYYAWFAAAGTYTITTPKTGAGTLKFGPMDDVKAVAGTDGVFTLEDVRVGERYRFELTLSSSGAISVQGNAVVMGISVDEYERYSSTIARLRKAVDMLVALEMTPSEIDHVLSHPAALRLDALPLAEVTDNSAARSTFAALKPWIDVAAARRKYGAGDRMVEVLRSARRSYDVPNQEAAFETALDEALSALTGWKTPFIETVRTALGYAVKTTPTSGTFVIEVPGLDTGAALRSVTDAVAALIRLGLKPEDVVAWSTKAITPDIARKVRSALKGRYAPAAWRRIAQPIFDALRKKQRDALVAYLTHLAGAPYGETREELFEYLLLDPGTEPAVLASRIQLAISSVQLFVLRCLMNLEEETVAPSIIDAKRWEWMSRYRVWEVNRKMFVTPENWLDPEFRDDKTHLFRELEGALLQGDVSDDLVRTALYTYLQGLEAIARLDMMTMYFEPGASADGSTVHVIGRTQNAPYKYYYRKCSSRMWTPWEPLGVEVEGEHLALTVWRGRMHLFWVMFFQKAQGKDTAGSIKDAGDQRASALSAEKVVQLQLNWVEQIQGKWLNRSSTQTFLEARQFSGMDASSVESNRDFFLHVKIDARDPGLAGDDVLELHISHPGATTGERFRVFSKLAAPALEDAGTAPTPGPMNGIIARATKWVGEAPLSVQFIAESTQEDGKAPVSVPHEFRILEQGHAYRLLFPSNEVRLGGNETVPPASGRASGYVFAPQNAQHVVYRGTDGNIHDLWWTANGWFHSHAGAAAGADPATSDPHGYPLDELFVHCVAYAANRKLLELSWSQLDSLGDDAEGDATAAWRVETLFEAPSDVSKPVGRPFGGVFSPKRGGVYRTADGGLWAAVEGATPGSWDNLRLNGGTAPAIASDPAGLIMTETSAGVTTVKSRHVFFRGADGNLHELRSDAAGTTWSHTNITLATGSPQPAPDAHPSAYAFQGQKTLHVVYRAMDGVIHELWGPVGVWNHNAIGAAFGLAAGDPSGYVTEFGGTQHVVYRAKDDQIHELWWSAAGWQENILTQAVNDAPKAEGDPTGYSFERRGTQHVVYPASHGQLRELWWDLTGWHLGRYELAKPDMDPIGPLIAPFFFEDQEAPYTFFVEPSLAEKTVHDWKEYVVTTEEYVQHKVPISIGAVALFPGLSAVEVSDLGVLQPPSRDRLFRDDLLVSTSKGVFSSAGGVRALTGPVTGSTEMVSVKVLDSKRGGAVTMKETPGILRTVAVRGGKP
jgi:hypothetical protein